MEENDTIKIGQAQKNPELSMEDLKGLAKQLSIQNEQLRRQLQESNMTYVFTVLDYLFKVLDSRAVDEFDKDFIKYVVTEIQNKIYDFTKAPETKTEEKNE